MSRRSILVVVVDGLRASALGAYGNTTYATPALDEFAAESILFDWCYAPAAELADVYRALWQAVHPARSPSKNDEYPSLPRLLAAAGYATTLVTDEPGLTPLAAAADFGECMQLAAETDAEAQSARCGDVAQTALARLFASTSEAIVSEAKSAPRLVWLHARGMYGPWDAPLELQRDLLDEGDPPPVESPVPPNSYIGEADDPDAAFRYSCAYAAQVTVLDSYWKGLIDALHTAPGGDQWLVLLLAARGFALGEHRRIGGIDTRLYGEQLHVPWLVRFPDGRGRLGRSDQLVSHFDLLPTLLEWLGESHVDLPKGDGTIILPPVNAARAEGRDAVLAISSDGACSIRTHDWCLRQDGRGSEAGELFVRPDDRWEANDVAKLCPDVVEKLSRAAEHLLQLLARNEPLPRQLLADDIECR